MIDMSARVRLPTAIAIVTLLSLISMASPAATAASDTGNGDSSWTFLAYMSADVAGSPLSWQNDINELEGGYLSPEIGVFCLVDPEGDGDSKIFSIAHDSLESEEIVSEEIEGAAFIQETGEVNMGDPQTLIDFAELIIDDHYIGGRFGIIFWGHGEGLYGVSLDKGDYLDIAELRYALIAIGDMLGKEVDLLVFDACSMGSLEAMSQLAETAEYAVSSEIAMASYGLPYDSIFVRLSLNPSMNTLNAARAFADEHVKYGALITGISSHAAVIDLDRLQEAKASLMEFSDYSMRFIPISGSQLIEARNGSSVIDGVNMVDLCSYLECLILSEKIPKRLMDSAASALNILSDSIAVNRAYINVSDSVSGLSLSGLSIFYPLQMVPGESYENVSDIAKSWSGFLRELILGENVGFFEFNITLSMIDGRFGDGLNDTAVLNWNSNNTIETIDFDLFREYDGILVDNCSENMESGGISIDWLDPDIYAVHVYCRDLNGSYRHYSSFESVSILRKFEYRVNLTAILSQEDFDIVLFNLDSGRIERAIASGNEAVIGLSVPDRYRLGDRVLVQVLTDGEIAASGMIIVGDGADAEVSMTMGRSMSSSLEYSCTMLLAALIIFSFIKLMKVGEEAGLSIRGIRYRRLLRSISSLSTTRGTRKAWRRS